MAKQLNVDLRFSADTSQAKKAIADLQASLQKIATIDTSQNGFNTVAMRQAVESAKQLSIHLSNAYNTTTGNFDLSKLNNSLRLSNQNVQDLASNLLNAGTSGQAAFVQLSQAIATADRPMISLNSGLQLMWTTLKNVARFQISSSIIHGLVGGIQSAYHYAQNLNESLTNIRIVTGQSVSQMAQFADEANKAAKTLSASTLDYTNASLIYYQQGLSDEAVKARTDVTVKLANVTGQAAEAVSNQMTAIWNNFDDGSHSLEYFADVITALGATTASSSQEIAKGLEKFAPIAGTIGLSYETATAALATIVANTRQSADTVGTGLRTIFSRFESLKLGETLEDGVDLTKYTKALKTVGVEVLDVNGKLKDADTILYDIASKWELLDNTQKTALATTVGGVRQYSTMMALFNNWDDMLKNIETVGGSTGALQEQANRYAEGWEAARVRVQAAAQAIYQDLIDDQFFISLTNGFEKLLSGIDNFIDNIGGIKPLLLGIGSLFLGQITNKIQPALAQLAQNIRIAFTGATVEAKGVADQVRAVGNTAIASGKLGLNEATAIQNANALSEAKNRLMLVNKNLTDSERQTAQATIDLMQAYANEAQTLAQSATAHEQKIQSIHEEQAAITITSQLNKELLSEEESLMEVRQQAQERYNANMMNPDAIAGLLEANTALSQFRENAEYARTAQDQLLHVLQTSYEGFLEAAKGAEDFDSALRESGTTIVNTEEAFGYFIDKLTQIGSSTGKGSMKPKIQELTEMRELFHSITQGALPEVEKAFDKALAPRNSTAMNQNIKELIEKLKGAGLSATDLEKILNRLGQGSYVSKIRTEYKNLSSDLTGLQQKTEQLNQTLSSFEPTHLVTGIERITAAASTFGSLAMSMNAIRSIMSALSNDSLSFGEKLSSVFMGISMLVPSLITAFTQLNTITNGYFTNFVRNAVAAATAQHSETAATLANTAAKRLAQTQDVALTAAGIARLAVKKGIISAEYEEAVAQAIENAQKAKGSALTAAEIVKTIALTVVKGGEVKLRWANVVAMAAEKSALLGLLAVAAPYLLAIVAIGAAIGAVINKQKKMAEEMRNNAQANNESTQKALDQIKANKDLISSLDEVYLAYQNADKTSESFKQTQEQLKEAVLKAADAYGITKTALAEVNNEYEELIENINQARLGEIQRTIAEAQSGINSRKLTLGYTAMDYELGPYKQIDQNTGYLFGTLASNTEFSNWIGAQDYSHLHGGQAGLAVNAENFNEIIALYEEIDQAIADASTHFGDSVISMEGYQNLLAFRDSLQSAYTEYINYEKEITDLKLEEAFRSLPVDLRTPTSTEEFRTLRQSLIDDLMADAEALGMDQEEIEAAVDAYLKSLSGIRTFAVQAQGADEWTEKYQSSHTGLGSGRTAEDFADQYSSIYGMSKDEALSIILTLSPYLDQTGLNAAFQAAQEAANQNKITLALEVVKSGEELINGKDTTTDDYINWFSQFVDQNGEVKPDSVLGQYGDFAGKTITDFLSMTLEEQQALFDHMNEALDQAEAASVAAEKEALQVQHAHAKYAREHFLQTGAVTDEVFDYSFNLDEGTTLIDHYRSQQAYYQNEVNNASSDSEREVYQGYLDQYNELIAQYNQLQADIQSTEARLGEITVAEQAEAALAPLQELKELLSDWNLDYDEVREYAKYLSQTGETAGESADSLMQLAARQMLLERGTANLNKEYKNFYDLLKNNKDSQAFSTSLKTMQSAMAEFVGGLDAMASIDPEGTIFDADFFAENEAIITKAMEGDLAAIEALQTAAAKQVVMKMELEPSTQEDVNNIIDEMQALIPDDIKIGTSIGEIEGMDAWLNSLNELMANGQMTADQVNAVLSSIGFDPEISYKQMTVTGIGSAGVDGSQVVTLTGPDGETVQMTLSGSAMEGVHEGGVITLPVINADATRSTGGGGGGGNSGGGGGGGGNKKKDMPKKDRSSRYHQVTQKQDKNKRRQEAAQDTADRTVGRTRIKQLERQIKLEKESLELSKQKLKEAQKYLEIDKKDLETALKKSGLKMKIEYDADGNITNYEAIMAAIQKQKEELVKKYNAGKISDDKYDEELKKLEDLAEAASNYEETLETAQEAAEAMVDSINRMLDLQLEKITYDIEFQIELNNQDLAVLEHLFDKIDDDVYSTAASIGILGREMQVLLDSAKKYQQDYANIKDEMYKEADKWRNKAKDDTELQGMLMNYGFYERAQEELKKEIPNWDKLSAEEQQKKIKDRAYKNWQNLSNEEIINYLNGAGYTEKLEQLQSDILDLDSQIDDIIDKINQQVINAFNELYDKEQEQIEIFDHYGKVFDNLSTIADLTKGAIGSANAKALQDMLRDRNIVNQGNRLDSSYKLYQQMVAKRKEYEQKLTEATTEEEKKLYEDLAEAAREKERETLEQWQEDLTNVLQSVHDKAEGLMDDVVEEFKKSFINGFGTEDYFNDIYEKAQTNADMFMEDYEKLYRVNELEHQSNKLLEKLDNPKYRKEVLAFQEKLTQYKDKQYKMSQQQVEAEQKWLDLIQARIALEDAQNAKQTVRLQRDNEGNWGYVFTNDADTIADAEAAVEKGIYEYQKALEDGGKSVNDSMRQVSEEYAETMAELQKQLLDGIIDQEEYDKQVERVKGLAQARIDALQKLAHWFWETLEGTSDEMNDIYHTEGQEAPSFGNTVFAQMFGFDSIDEAFNTDGFLEKLDKLKNKTLEIYQNYVGETNTYLDKVDMSVQTLTDDITAWGNAITTASDQNVTAVQQMAEAFDDVMLKSIQAVEREWEKWLTDLKETQQMLLDLVTSIGDLNREIYYAGDHTDDNPVGTPSQEEIDAGTVEQPSGQPSTEPPPTGTKALNNLPSKTDINNELYTAQGYSDLYNWIQEYSLQEDLINTLLQYLDLQARQASYGFGNIMSGTYTSSTGDTIQQEVHIDANFPSVTNSSEIEEAFENLVNKAAQYANRKRQG